jgi:hypothetical protein
VHEATHNKRRGSPTFVARCLMDSIESAMPTTTRELSGCTSNSSNNHTTWKQTHALQCEQRQASEHRDGNDAGTARGMATRCNLARA